MLEDAKATQNQLPHSEHPVTPERDAEQQRLAALFAVDIVLNRGVTLADATMVSHRGGVGRRA